MKFTFNRTNRVISCEYEAAGCGSCRVQEHKISDVMPGDTLVDLDGNRLCAGCGEMPENISEAQEVYAHGIHHGCRKQKVKSIVTRFGQIDGAHHKQWVIDQMLRACLSEQEYRDWVNEMNSDPDYDPWDEGIAP